MTISTPEPGELVKTVSELVTAVNAGSGSSTVPVPAADVGYTLDTTTYDNSITGTGKMAVAVFPADTAMAAFAIEGDAFPRIVLHVNAGNFSAISIGNGVVDPVSGDGSHIGLNNDTGNPDDMDLVLSVPIGRRVVTTGTALFSSGKVIAFNGFGTGNSAPATTPGNIVAKMEVFSLSGSSLGFIPIYDVIT